MDHLSKYRTIEIRMSLELIKLVKTKLSLEKGLHIRTKHKTHSFTKFTTILYFTIEMT